MKKKLRVNPAAVKALTDKDLRRVVGGDDLLKPPPTLVPGKRA